MKKNLYDIKIFDKNINDFEFIVGPMVGISTSLPPLKPEEFLCGCLNGGATPIMCSRELVAENYLNDILNFSKVNDDKYFGVNVLCLWKNAEEFLKKFNPISKDLPVFVDLNAIEMVFEKFIPLMKEIDVPIYVGIHQPISIYTFRKLILKKENSFLLDKISEGKLKIYIPRNIGGGHLPIMLKEDIKVDWLDKLVNEVQGIEEEIKMPFPFIVEKGMMTVDDFADTIKKYSVYPSFSGVRFASNLILTKEAGLSDPIKSYIIDMIEKNDKNKIMMVRSQLAAVRKGDNVRGGVLCYVLATKLMKKLHDQQCEGEDFPKIRRKYKSDVIKYQGEITDRYKKRECKDCHDDCPSEVCGLQLLYHAQQGNIEDSTVTLSPKIFNIDPAYINSSVEFVVRDLISKTQSKIKDMDLVKV